MSSDSARSASDEPSGGWRSRETVKVYVPDSVGLNDGRTASISRVESDLSNADGVVLKCEAVDDVEEGRITVTLPSLVFCGYCSAD